MADQNRIIPFGARKPGLDPTVTAAIDATIERLARKRFVADPIISDPRYSQIASIVSSAYKRHGAIIQMALREALITAGLQVSDERCFLVSKEADALAHDDGAMGAHLPYGVGARKVQVDLLVVKLGDTLGAYEVKRGFGNHDAGKIRSMLRDLRCVRMLLRSYGEQILGVRVDLVTARLISYYGKRDLPRTWTLAREDLETHFSAPVTGPIEAANRYFSERLDSLLEVIE